MCRASILFAWLVLTASCSARIIYVDDDTTSNNDGSSWADAYNSLQDALADANSSPKPVEIWVAQGIYRPDESNGVASGDRTATFQLINGVAIRGGYAGFGEPDPNSRDIESYETILTGDLDGNDVNLDERWDLWNEPSRSDNSYHVVTGGTDDTAVLDGFTITGGNANGADDGNESQGGGMYTDSGGTTVIDCTFRGSSARTGGGGMYCSSSVVSITNCTFRMNAAKHGGGIQSQTNDLTFINCKFSGNKATFAAGGMVIYDSNALLVDCMFAHNAAGHSVGALGIGNSNVTLTSCMFIGNWTPWPSPLTMGGGGAGGLAIGGGKAIVTDCIFRGNSATGGGGMTNTNADLTLTNCIFAGNSAVYPGGGMANCGRTVPAKITNCIFSGNSAGQGGGIYNTEFGSSFILTNCTFSGNSAHAGGAISNGYSSSATLISCILWANTADHGPQAELAGNSALNIKYSCIQDSQAGIYDPYHGLIWGEGNVDGDPCFAQPGYWDPNGTPQDANDDFWVEGEYHLKSQARRYDPNAGTWVRDEVTSPCIDAGNPMSPIGREPFPNGGVVNMGAYGGTAEASKSYFGEPLCETIVAGDINGDCKVNFLDFRLIALHWLTDYNPQSDANLTKKSANFVTKSVE